MCLDLTPLNFPLGCGSGPDLPQFPPWVWAWREGVSLAGGDLLGGGSPWQRGLLCRGGLGRWGFLGRGVLPGRGVSQHALRQTPPLNRMTDRCKNITLPQTSFAGGNEATFVSHYFGHLFSIEWNSTHGKMIIDCAQNSASVGF